MSSIIEDNVSGNTLTDFSYSLIHNHLYGILAFDLEYKCTVWNPFMEHLSGKKKEDVLGMPVLEIMRELSGDDLGKLSERTLHGESMKARIQLKSRENKDFHYEACCHPKKSAGGDIRGGIVVLQDITHLVEVEKALQASNILLKESKEKLEETQQLAQLGSWERDLRTGKADWEDFLCREIYEISDSTERSFGSLMNIIHPDDREFLKEKVEKIIRDPEEERVYQYRIYSGKGNLKYLSSYTRPVLNERGEVVKVRGYSQDITRLKSSEVLLKAVLDHTFHGILYVKPVCENDQIIDFECVISNSTSSRLLNLGDVPATGKWLVRDFNNNDHKSGMFPFYVETYESGKEFQRSHFYPQLNRWLSIHVVKMEEGLLLNFADITEFKILEGELKGLNCELERKVEERTQEVLKEKEHFQLLAEAIPQLVFISSGDQSEYINQRWSAFCGLQVIDSIDRKWWGLMHPEDQDATALLWKKANEEGSDFNTEYRIRRHDGAYIWFMVRAIPVKDEAGRVMRWFGTCTDIHQLKQAEESLKAQSLILTNMAEGVTFADKDGMIRYTNPALEKIFGYDGGELIGKSCSVLNEGAPGADDQFDRIIRELIDKGSWEGKIRNRRKDGTSFISQAHINRVMLKGEMHFISVQSDITEAVKNQELLQESAEKLNRLNIELMQKNAQLVRINNDLDNFIYTASHDLKAPVSNIEGLVNALTDTMSEESRNSEETRHVIDLIRSSIKRFKSTINDLTEITKVNKESEELQSVSFQEITEEVCCVSIKNLIETNQAHIETLYEVDTIHFSKKNLRSILYNLISNGIKYRSMGRPPLIMISTSRTKDNEVLLTVSDNGLGIERHEKNKLFHMFKRLHDHVEGSGVGLYIVKRIIDNAGGRIEVESEVGKGSTFRIYFKSQQV